MELPDTNAESILDLLQADDAQVATLFDRHAAAEENRSPAAVRDRLLGRVCESLSIQRMAEEEVLYPAIRASGDKLVFAFLLAGLGISMRIGEILDPASPRATREFSVLRLKELVARNLLERAEILFPFVRSRLSRIEMAWLGDDYLERKARLWAISSPAHAAHPSARKPVATLPWQRRAQPNESRPR